VYALTDGVLTQHAGHGRFAKHTDTTAGASIEKHLDESGNISSGGKETRERHAIANSRRSRRVEADNSARRLAHEHRRDALAPRSRERVDAKRIDHLQRFEDFSSDERSEFLRRNRLDQSAEQRITDAAIGASTSRCCIRLGRLPDHGIQR
jgi:hypothetical protein